MLNQEKKSKYYLVATSGDLVGGAMGAYSSNYEIEEQDVEMFSKYLRLEQIHLREAFNECDWMKGKYTRKFIKLQELRDTKYRPFVKEKLNNPSKYFYRSHWTITKIG